MYTNNITKYNTIRFTKQNRHENTKTQNKKHKSLTNNKYSKTPNRKYTIQMPNAKCKRNTKNNHIHNVWIYTYRNHTNKHNQNTMIIKNKAQYTYNIHKCDTYIHITKHIYNGQQHQQKNKSIIIKLRTNKNNRNLINKSLKKQQHIKTVYIYIHAKT